MEEESIPEKIKEFEITEVIPDIKEELDAILHPDQYPNDTRLESIVRAANIIFLHYRHNHTMSHQADFKHPGLRELWDAIHS